MGCGCKGSTPVGGRRGSTTTAATADAVAPREGGPGTPGYYSKPPATYNGPPRKDEPVPTA